MLVVFGAFKSEVYGLLRLMSHKKIVKGFKSTIYTGKIHNHEIIVVVTGMGKFNAKTGVDDIILLNPANPVFLIQGISGALIGNLKIGDLVIYEAIKNLEGISGARYIKPNNLNDFDCIKQVIELQNLDGSEVIAEDFENLKQKAKDVPEYLKSGNCPDDFNRDEVKLINGINNFDFDVQAGMGDNGIFGSGILKVPGATVPHVITNYDDKVVLSKTYDVAAVDMESFYIADAAIKRGIPVICIRSISDNLSEGIPIFFIESDRSSIFKKFLFLLKMLFSRSKTNSVLKTIKNINLANKNLNDFIIKTVLSFLGYK